MQIGDKVVVWGAVMEESARGHKNYTIAMQYGKNICEILKIQETDNGNILKLSYKDPEDNQDFWIGWVHEKQIEKSN